MADQDPAATPQPQPAAPAAEAAPQSAAAAGADAALQAAESAVKSLETETAAAPPAPGATDAAADALQTAQDTQAAAQAAASPGAAPGAPADGAAPVDLPKFSPDANGSRVPSELRLLSDVNLHVKIELGRTRMLVEDVLRLGEGSVVELDKLAGDPVDVYVNDRHVARGEVLVVNENFCVRISEIIDGARAESA